MDKPLISEQLLDGAIIAYANDYQFLPSERVRHEKVESRLFLWNRRGAGSVEVNGAKIELQPGEYLFAPWHHEIVYEADSEAPFLVGAVHLIPHQPSEVPFICRISHGSGDWPEGRGSRRDVAWPGLSGLLYGRLDDGFCEGLAQSIVRLFQRDFPGHNSERTLRDMARLLVLELAVVRHRGPAAEGAIPRMLRMMQTTIRNRLAEPLTVAVLAAEAGCSPATVHRLFARFLNSSPHDYLAQTRIREAERLLGATSLPVNEVAMRVGFPDPYHFSRFFRRRVGVSPRAYRQERLFIP